MKHISDRCTVSEATAGRGQTQFSIDNLIQSFGINR